MQPRTGEEWYRQNCKCVNFPEGNLVWFERCWDEAIKFAKSAKNAEGSDQEDQGDEEIIKLDLKKARESGFEYIITYNSTPITGLPDDLKHYKNENYMAIIKKRHIKTDSAKQP